MLFVSCCSLIVTNFQVWTCGLNVYHQLGHIPPVERSLVPKPISLKFLKGKKVIGVRAARFHSVIFTKDCIYTFGLNAGQLGNSNCVFLLLLLLLQFYFLD